MEERKWGDNTRNVFFTIVLKFLKSSFAGIQEGTQCTKCKNNWALKFSIILLYILCALLTITVAILGYKGMYAFSTTFHFQLSIQAYLHILDRQAVYHIFTLNINAMAMLFVLHTWSFFHHEGVLTQRLKALSVPWFHWALLHISHLSRINVLLNGTARKSLTNTVFIIGAKCRISITLKYLAERLNQDVPIYGVIYKYFDEQRCLDTFDSYLKDYGSWATQK